MALISSAVPEAMLRTAAAGPARLHRCQGVATSPKLSQPALHNAARLRLNRFREAKFWCTMACPHDLRMLPSRKIGAVSLNIFTPFLNVVYCLASATTIGGATVLL